MPELKKLCHSISYDFNDISYLQTALTHRSANKRHYERLEFLGDSILSFVISSELYRRFPKAREGQLSRMRASLVKGDTLAVLAKDLNLGDYLILGSGELKSGGFRRSSILADCLEAIIGAIYLDGGTEAARTFILNVFDTKLDNASPDVNLKDPKTQLQEYLQANGQELPVYEITETKGQAHNQVFYIECQVGLLEQPVTAKGTSRRKAEQTAARKVLDMIKKQQHA